MSARAKKVALVYDAIFPYVKGGGEKRFHELGKQLAKDGYDVHLYGMKFWEGPKTIKRFGMTLHGIAKARPLYTKTGRRSIAQALLFGFSCFKLIRENFDFIDCCGFPYFSSFACRFVAFLKGKKMFSTWHEVWGRAYWREYLGVLGNVGFAVEWLAARTAHTFIAVSPHTAQALRSALGVKRPIHVIPNGVSIGAIAGIAPAEVSSDIMYSGRLVAFKHVDILLHAFAKLHAEQPALKLMIVGDGPERTTLETLAGELGVANHVTFAGFYDEHNDVIAAMKASKVLVLPSSREGFGLVALEANAAGVPVVTVDEPGNAAQFFIDGSNGVVTRLNANDLAVAIKQTLQKGISAEQCIKVAGHYDWATATAKLEAIWK